MAALSQDWVLMYVSPNSYESRCTFQDIDGIAKCDFAIPNKEKSYILIEVKGYGATGPKMSDIIGDVDAIINAKRSDARLLLLTDGLTWKSRRNDLRKLIQRQNEGRITRIYTKQFSSDLLTLKGEYGI
ncbi:MAG: DpnII family type II restriction endonuclease [Cyanobacteria bacterium MAG IRC3_bin_20]|nr:DpnII family type II restriction endonuclease [Cyanobacteria bacterium MAG IRC3_bin_20]